MLTTNNREWGFFGTARQDNDEAFAEEAWKAAFEHVNAWMGWGEELTRDFLDSRMGRHYADDMHGRKDWREALTRAWDLEHNCRAFYKEVDPQGYRRWCLRNGQTPTERVLRHTGITKKDIHRTVSGILGLDYQESQTEEWIRRAGPLARAFAMILADIPEEIWEMNRGHDAAPVK